jgi:hypothetical protein
MKATTGSSSITGWTREHWVAAADRTLRAVQPYATAQHALIHLPGAPSRSGVLSDGLEGFARTFLAAAFRMAGDPEDPTSSQLASWYGTGLVAGTEPGSAEQWPSLAEVHQARVEAASIAIALHETRSLIWDHITPHQQGNVVDWLSGAVGVEYPGNNWVWFQNVVQAFLGSVGAQTCEADIERNLARIEEWYSGDGWYTDGAFAPGEHRCYDHYSGWAMQFYPIWWSRMLGASADPGRSALYKSRLNRWLEQAQHLIGADGAPLYHGRSLTYRFAVLAPFWAGVVAEVTPLSLGRTRRLASGVLGYFDGHGAFGEDGRQKIGWHGKFLPIRQWYSGPGSPYWSSKGFAGLVLPLEHPVWTCAEEPLALEIGDVELAMPVPGWIISATKADGIVRMVNHGGDHHPAGRLGIDETIYGRVAYSTATAPDSGLDSETTPTDSSVVLVDERGRASHRRPLERLSVSGRVGLSRHRAHWLVGAARDTWQHEADGRPDSFEIGPWVTVASVLHGAVEIRVVRVDFDADSRTGPAGADGSPAPAHSGPWKLQIGGHPLAGSEALEQSESLESPEGAAARAMVSRSERLCASVVALHGSWLPQVHSSKGANAMGSHTGVPTLISSEHVVDGELAAVAVILSGRKNLELRKLADLVLSPDMSGCAVSVTWLDGETDTFRLDPPELSTRSLGTSQIED